MTNKEYEYIIEQQKELIKQQKELIDKLLARNDRVIIEKEIPNYPYPYYNTPPTITCSDKIMPCCTEAPMDKNKYYTSYSTTSASSSDKPAVIDLEGKTPDEFVIYNNEENKNE